jgi:pimeloyl-ACP methyl ester carboxylesterase
MSLSGRIVLTLLVGFCWYGRLPAAPPTETTKGGVVFLVGGIGGIDFIALSARLALPRAGVPHELRELTWCHGTGRFLRDLQDTRHVLSKAEELAGAVRQVKEANPDRPVYLVGHSGGAGLILAAAEMLPPATLERIILLSAAVSPTYDLRPALRATRCEIVSYNSELDLLLLDWGTTRFGTVDRVYGSAAGLNGFIVPGQLCEEDRALYRRLVQVAWQPSMVLKNHGGMHSSTIMPGFLARHVAPWLKP